MSSKGYKHTEEAKKKMRLSKLGRLNPCYGKHGTCLGRKQTSEQIKKIKEARSKQIITIDHRIKISEGVKVAYTEGRLPRGEDHPQWRGGTLSETIKIRRSIEMRLWREAVFKRDDYTCQDCKVRGGHLQAHHIKQFAFFPELRFAIDNGVTLCKTCHLKTENWGNRTGFSVVGTLSAGI